jgi:hypothetical protein
MPRLCQLRPNAETPTDARMPPFRRDKCGKGERSLSPKTGWWRMQSSETGLQGRNREFVENFSPKQAFEET